MTEDDLERKLASARKAAPSWTLARQQQAVWRARGQLQQRRKAILSLAALSAAAAAGALLWVGVQQFGSAPEHERAFASASAGLASSSPEQWNLRDGSLISMETRSTVVRKKSETSRELVLELEAGAADFDVARRPERAFFVHAGRVIVRVTGTRFRVERSGERASVTVRRGSVLVEWPGGSRSLAAGDSGVFPPTQAVGLASSEPVSQPLPPPKELASASAGKASLPMTHDPVRDGSLSEPEALFARSDRARTEGRFAEAATLLKTLADRFPRDPRAPLAAFTRGRILLESLGRPSEAASAFSQARALSQSAIAEDALAREVEAYRAAGDLSRARERAELYRRTYPNGVRLRQVMRSGGLPARP